MGHNRRCRYGKGQGVSVYLCRATLLPKHVASLFAQVFASAYSCSTTSPCCYDRQAINLPLVPRIVLSCNQFATPRAQNPTPSRKRRGQNPAKRTPMHPLARRHIHTYVDWLFSRFQHVSPELERSRSHTTLLRLAIPLDDQWRAPWFIIPRLSADNPTEQPIDCSRVLCWGVGSRSYENATCTSV